MTDSTPSWADGNQPTTPSSTTDLTPSPAAPDVPPMPAAPPAPATATGKPSTRRTLTTLLIGAVAGAAIVGGTWYTTSSSSDTSSIAIATDGKPAAAKGTFTLNGEFVLTDGAVDDGAGGCEGSGGYDDIALGTSVTVYDAAGAVIATSSLLLSEFDRAAGTCTYDVSVDGVPGGKNFYQVEISHRGKIQLSAEEATSGAFAGSLG